MFFGDRLLIYYKIISSVSFVLLRLWPTCIHCYLKICHCCHRTNDIQYQLAAIGVASDINDLIYSPFVDVCFLLPYPTVHVKNTCTYDKNENSHQRQWCNTEVIQISTCSWNTASRYRIHTWNRTWKSGESAKKSDIYDLGILEFEDEKVWTNNIGEKKEQRRLNQSLWDCHWKGSLTVGEFLWISTERGHFETQGYKLF